MLHAGGTGLILGRGTRIPHTTWCDQKKIKKKCWKRHLFKGPTALELPAFRKGGLEGPKLLFIKEVLKIPIFMCPLSLLLLFFSRSVMSDSLQCHGLQHARLPCPSLLLRVCSNSCPLSKWCYLTISSSAVFFSFCPQSFPAWGSLSMSQSFTSGGQSIGASASASVLPMNIQDWFPIGWTGWISLLSHHLRWFWSPPKIKSDTVSIVSPSICQEVMGPDAMIFVFWMLSFRPTFSLSSFTSSRGSLALLYFLP